MNRYISLSYHIFGIANSALPTIAVCRAGVKAGAVMTILQYVPWAGFSGLRAYALCRNRPISALIFLLCMVPFGLYGVYIWALDGTIIARVGCVARTELNHRTAEAFVIGTRSSLMSADILLISITWATLYRQGISFKDHSLAYTLVRDGSVYFMSLLTLNTLHLVFTLHSVATATISVGSYVILFTEPLTAVLVSRFMLNLQAVDRRTRHRHTEIGTLDGLSTRIGTDTLVFNRVVGSLASFGIERPQEGDAYPEDVHSERSSVLDEVPSPASSESTGSGRGGC
ncbi:hypothetical protein C8Q76DRAFT_740260 [Earliella scabrosa]|nr:hypothetical protein C8Q76DRAFT_740260 [Earliella scabrosa]